MTGNDPYAPYRVNRPMDKELIPEPIFEANSAYIELYWKAWELAWSHVLHREDMPSPDYIDEAMNPDTIWIWDSCFMVLFMRYAHQLFPGIQTLNNFYYIMQEGQKNVAKVHHPDNPPLFAWVEWEHFKITGDLERLRHIISQKKYLQTHYYWLEHAKRGKKYGYANVFLFATKKKHGFMWSGVASGMDNTPRGRGYYGKILWLDLAAQQGLSAKSISEMANLIGETKIAEEFKVEYEKYKSLLNEFYWNEELGSFVDISRWNPKKKINVITPATYWPMLAEMLTAEQANKIIKLVQDPNLLGGFVPFPTVARNDKEFDPLGQYWKGGVWLPTSYMSIKAFEKYGMVELADKVAQQTLDHILFTYQQFKPATIWEAYSPVKYEPSTYKRNARLVRPDFCGWSALGPISLLIENILGFREINAIEKQIKWDIKNKCKHGLRRLRFGKFITDLIYEDGTITLTASDPYSLQINGKIYEIEKGNQTITL